MKTPLPKLLKLISILLLFMWSTQSIAQVTNGSYTLEIHYLQGYGRIDTDPTTDGEQTHTGKVALNNNTNGPQVQLFDLSSGASNQPKTCYISYSDANAWGPAVDYNIGTLYGSTNGRFDWTFFTWEDDAGNACDWDNDDDNRAYIYNYSFATSYTQASWYQYPDIVNSVNGSAERMKSTWRYTNGEKTSALDFGTLGNAFYTHINTNRGVPAGAATALGYKNQWTPADYGSFRGSNDVTYKFRITSSKRIAFSTDYSETNFDTYLHVVKLNEDGSFNSYIEGDDDDGNTGNTSYLQRDLCPGLYGVIIEGYDVSHIGDFRLGLSVSDVSVTPGTIAISTNNGQSLSLCPNATIPAINSTANSTSTLGTITYYWKISTYNNGAWSSWSDYPSAGYGASATNLGNIGTNEAVAFYREARDCGSVYGTSSVTFNRYTPTVAGGTIGGGTMIPYPRELALGTMTSSVNASGNPDITVVWEKDEGGGWVAATPAGTGQTYTLPELTVTTKFRRKVINTCPSLAPTYSNEQTITVVNPNGVLQGRVTSKTGSGVNNVTISAKRTTAVTGGAVNKTYTTTTGIDGTYSLAGIYYGSTSLGSGATANFTITPSKNTHVFDPTALNRTVSQTLPIPPDANFVDKTVFSVLGRVTQKCATCDGGTVLAPIVCPAANIEFLIDNAYLGNKTLTNGNYALSMDEQRNYTVKPRYKNHKFSPSERIIPVGDAPSIENMDFADTTTHTISGTFFAGCNEYIGQAILKFSQILPDVGGNPATPCIIKTDTSNLLSGFYSIRLPAGKYRVSFEGFIKGGTGTDLNALTVKDFFNQKVLIQDSLTRDIDEKNAILNLVYPRPPVLEVIGLNTVCTPVGNVCSPAQLAKPYSLMAQNDSTAFTIKVWQGPAKTCPAKDSLVYLHSNIQQDDTSQDFVFANPTGSIAKKLKGGLPNIVCPYFKTFNLQYTDRYKRAAADINKNVVVTGLKSDIGTFTTVSPEIPFKVLHDPQGDLSYSFWEANKTTQEAIRFYRTETDNTNGWAEVKLGTAFAAGLGLTVETAIWGTIKGSLTSGARNVTSNESILSISNSQFFSTANNEDVVGAQGDVYIGSAINLLYSKTNVLTYTSPCTLTLKADFIIAPDGFATEYVYSEDHIVNTVIPTLTAFRDNPSATVPEKAKYANQVSVWEQTLANNDRNKKRAPFEKNISFDGAVGQINASTTTSATKSSTIEFGLEVNEELAIELGMEIGGSGLSGGVIINAKLETGGSTTNTTINSTTTGYVLDDGDNGDYFSIDIKKDPVYDTPVFQLVAGTSSCPWEAGTQPRDEMQLVCAVPSISDIPAAGEAEFTLLLSNTSQSGEARTYLLSFDQSSNPSGATVTIGGSPVVGSTPYVIAYLGSVQVVVKVKKGSANVFSYTGLKFNLKDACDGGISKSVLLNAYFDSPCSNITLTAPNDGFSIITNTVQVILKDYTIANLTNVSLEYSKVGTSSWSTAFTKTAAQLSPDPSGTLVTWNIANIVDGKYNLRLKLLCSTNVTYSQTITGVIDRVAPKLFGNPEPTDDNYVAGDQISAAYNEILGCANLNTNNLIVKNLKTNAIIPAQLGCFDNKIMIVPLASLGATLDSIRVTLQNIQDLYGNVKTTPDSWKFILGTSVAATGNKALSMNSNNTIPTVQSGVLTNAGSISISKMENAAGTLDFYFNLPANAPNDFLINYSISGSASAANDYTVSFLPSNRTDGRKLTSNQFNGSFGTITILQGQKTARLLIDPIDDSKFEGDETIIITVNEGGDYGIAASYSMTGIILNDDEDDCLNGGNPYLVSNNTAGNTAIAAGTYHKSLLETDGDVVSPTLVTMKGAKSVVMKPGFEVKTGGIFKANIEGCPPTKAPYSITSDEKPDLTASNENSATFTADPGITSEQITSAIQYEPNVFAAVSDKKIYFEFTLEEDENVTLVLFNSFAGEVLKVIDKTDYKAGTYTAEIETATLKKGDYFIQMITKDKKTYQKVTVTK